MTELETGLIYRRLDRKPYTGSYRGMRYHLRAADGEILASVYPGPLCLERTPPQEVTVKAFPFDEEGRKAMTDWLLQMYESQKSRWEEARLRKI